MGTTTRPIQKQIFDNSGLAAHGTATILGAKAIPCGDGREITLIGRMHSIPGVTGGVTWPDGASITIVARADAPTSEDPADFTRPNPQTAGTDDLATITFTYSSDSPPTVRLANIIATQGSNIAGAWIRLYVRASVGTTTGTFQVMLSVDVNVKS